MIYSQKCKNDIGKVSFTVYQVDQIIRMIFNIKIKKLQTLFSKKYD